MKEIILFDNKENCCGCGSCVNVCPKQAITMCSDKNGFVYPFLDKSKCILCGRCIKVCSYKKEQGGREPIEVYVSATKDSEILEKSASGGVFTTIAKWIIEQGGCVYGCAFDDIDGVLYPRHICVSEDWKLNKLQGSKYVQSDMGNVYQKIDQQLKNGKRILFSGTPCQVAALKGYLGQDYENLYTVDIICHGVPSAAFFQSYVTFLMKRCKGEVVDFKFRDKNKGWGLNALIIWRDINAKEHSKSIPHGASSYYDMFLKSEIYRENCYSCPYAGEKREGDFTLGDYWGVQKEHPELMKDNGGVYNETKGVSCILVNTNKGKQLFQEIEHLLQCDLSTFEKVANGNLQLQKPSTLTLSREKIFDVYQEGGYAAVEKYFQKRNGMRTYYFYLKNMLPQSWKKTIKKIIKKG